MKLDPYHALARLIYSYTLKLNVKTTHIFLLHFTNHNVRQLFPELLSNFIITPMTKITAP